MSVFVSLLRRLRAGRRLRTLGIDDAPFVPRRPGTPVLVCGAVYNGPQFEGLLSCRVRQDGHDATTRVGEMIRRSKFRPQLHLVLLDGIGFGGFNLVDLPALAEAIGIGCVAVMRRRPDLPAMEQALARLPRAALRRRKMAAAGPIHRAGPLWIQTAGIEPTVAAEVLQAATISGNLPECLRAAHLIGAGVVLGESGHRA
jgi:endonuclease V-like protein UPF0215 family